MELYDPNGKYAPYGHSQQLLPWWEHWRWRKGMGTPLYNRNLYEYACRTAVSEA